MPPEAPAFLCTDSRHALGMAVMGWMIKANAELVGPLREALTARPGACVRWVAGHAGVEGNERVYALARDAAREGAGFRR